MKLRSSSLDDIVNELSYVLGLERGRRWKLVLWATRRAYCLTRRLALAALRLANRKRAIA